MLGVCYYPEHWPEDFWAKDARRMREIGIEYVRIGEFAWSRSEPQRAKFGSRRHYRFSSPAYRRESARIVEILAARYGRHDALAGWQTDNEYGCHDTTRSFGEEDLRAFREWLRRRYQSPDRLNEAWGSAFWSMELASFDQVELPNLAVTEANPAARLDFWRFSSDAVAAFNRMQCEIIRKHSPGRFITHNFMGAFNDFDHWKLGADLDFAAWDSYPLGLLETFPLTEAERGLWRETSHPDLAAFHHDLYRGVGRGRFWVMEQQPGPVNWAPWNPAPAPGMVRLWTIEAHAHGAEVVSYFRWRQAPFAQEQMHAGLNLPNAHELSPGGLEAAEAARDLARLGARAPAGPAQVAIVHDYEAHWVASIQPQGADFRYSELVFRWYEAVRRLGLDVDFVRPGVSLDGYRLVLAPSLPIVSNEAESAFAAARGVVAFGPRSGSKTRHFTIPEGLPPGPLRRFTPLRVIEVSSLRPGAKTAVRGAIEGFAERWRERVETRAAPLAVFADGNPALIGRDNYVYVAFWPDPAALSALMRLLCQKAGLSTVELPPHARLRRRGNFIFAFNAGESSWRAPFAGAPALGEAEIPARSFAVWRNEDRAGHAPATI